MTRRQLLSALRRITVRFGHITYTAYWHPLTSVIEIESHAHELAHRVVTGPDFEAFLAACPALIANLHEASALRVEATTLHALGIAINLPEIWQTTNWRIDMMPAIGDGLTRAERLCVQSMVHLIQREHTCQLLSR